MIGKKQAAPRSSGGIGAWQTHAIGFVLLASVLGAGLVLGLRPVLAQRDTMAELAMRQADLHARLDGARRQERILRDELYALEELGAGWNERAGQGATLNQSMAKLTQIGQSAGLSLHTVRAGDANALEFFEVTPIAVEGSGGYAQCAGFISEVLAAMPNVTIERFSLAAPGPGSGEGGAVSLVFAWYSDSGAQGAGESGTSG